MAEQLVLDLPRECCSFVDENEAFDVQFLLDGRIVCFSYGKEAFTTYWIIVDSFYGTKKIVITEVNKIDDWVLLLTMDSYLLRTFDGNYSIQIVQLGDLPNECRTRNLIEKTRGTIQKVSRYNDHVIIVLSIYETRFDELFKSTEFIQYKIDEWDTPTNNCILKDEHFNHVDFVGCSTTGNFCFFSSQGRIFHITDFETLIEVSPQNANVSRWPTDGLHEIFGPNIEHLAKNMSGGFYKDHFYLYLTPNPAVVKLEHYFLVLSLETRQWRRIYLNSPQFFDIIEVHMTISTDGFMILDSRNTTDERNIHRLPLSDPELLLHLSQFAVNRRHGNLAEMSEEEKKSKKLPLRLYISPAFDREEITKYSLSTKNSKIVISDALYQ
ncbi:hypothetical protein M3Y97_00488800 [Aphelenchoides bicaudatus]|nr:hypothetical protein M3Y97_00488800 [Aphelenchoides bicaudatus]